MTPVNAPVIDLLGRRLEGRCGVYRNYAFDLVDQDNDPISSTYTAIEYFSDHSGGLALQEVQIPVIPNAFITDLMYFGKVYPDCPGPNDNETFTQKVKVVFGSTVTKLLTEIVVSRGFFNGVPKVDETMGDVLPPP
jgi:hypothetical protein